jgi:hypothetical protein
VSTFGFSGIPVRPVVAVENLRLEAQIVLKGQIPCPSPPNPVSQPDGIFSPAG